MVNVHWRQVAGARHEVIHKRRSQQLAVFAVNHVLTEHLANALRHAAVDLPLHDRFVQHITDVIDRGIGDDVNDAGLRVNLDLAHVRAEREREVRRIVERRRLHARLEALGIRLEKEVAPVISHLAFNMNDPVVGRGKTKADRERNRRLRQAMSLVIDSREFLRIFVNGRGLAAESPIPPNIYGYDPDYRNPFRTPDLERARALMVEAGYPGGIDPKTGRIHSTWNQNVAATFRPRSYRTNQR